MKSLAGKIVKDLSYYLYFSKKKRMEKKLNPFRKIIDKNWS
ncbi:MAG TPA: hypothetical protein VMY43_07425 [Methanothrix sp.]|nr:hypothetical protein [Methanothrix sp.]